ncbi:alkene reductase [Phytomonospora sp. NPDC050363]|uniref:alkene reductase n=1 Tax=Phytomonospora sp. NPDC050363 TaxID=3155642 RepID=UPI0033EC0E71
MYEQIIPSPLLTPYRSAHLNLPNRVAMAPMSRARGDLAGLPHALTGAYYAQRAGAGLIVTEGLWPNWHGRGGPWIPGMASREHSEAWKPVTTAVHAAGGRVFAQLWHVGRLSHPTLNPDADAPLAPSAVAAPGQTHLEHGKAPFVTPRAMTLADIDRTIADYAASAKLAVDAGFDGVEIHGANGYLISQFLSDNANLRADGYGGDATGRIRLAVEITEAVADAVGAGRVGLRLSPGNPENGLVQADPAATARPLVDTVDRLGLAYLHISEKSAYPALADLRPRWNGTLIGNYDPAEATTREQGERMIAEGLADVVAFGRLFIANPDLPLRFATGAALAPVDEPSVYIGGARGYADYPAEAAMRLHAGESARV